MDLAWAISLVTSWFGGEPEALTTHWTAFVDPVPSRFFTPASAEGLSPFLFCAPSSDTSLSTDLLISQLPSTPSSFDCLSKQLLTSPPSSPSSASSSSIYSPAPLIASVDELGAWLTRRGVQFNHWKPPRFDQIPATTNTSTTETSSVATLPRPLRKVRVPRYGRYNPPIQQPRRVVSQQYVEDACATIRSSPSSPSSTSSPSPSLSPSYSLPPDHCPFPAPFCPCSSLYISPSRYTSPSPSPPLGRKPLHPRSRFDSLEGLAKYFAQGCILRAQVETGLCPIETLNEKLSLAAPDLAAGLHPGNFSVELDNDFDQDLAFVAEVD